MKWRIQDTGYKMQDWTWMQDTGFWMISFWILEFRFWIVKS